MFVGAGILTLGVIVIIGLEPNSGREVGIISFDGVNGLSSDSISLSENVSDAGLPNVSRLAGSCGGPCSCVGARNEGLTFTSNYGPRLNGNEFLLINNYGAPRFVGG